MTEREYKFLLTKEQFYKVMKRATELYSVPTEKMQTNHYYDDDALSLNRRGITVRIRQSDGKHRLQIKRHGNVKNGCSTSEETEQEINEITDGIALPEFGCLTYKGSLTTRRHSFAVCQGVSLDMDINTYLDLVDYEVEIEFDAGMRSQAEAVNSALGLETVNNRNKSARFFGRLSAQKAAGLERTGGIVGI